jgi:hypothetical protein
LTGADTPNVFLKKLSTSPVSELSLRPMNCPENGITMTYFGMFNPPAGGLQSHSDVFTQYILPPRTRDINPPELRRG